jgi:hypothetical protein
MKPREDRVAGEFIPAGGHMKRQTNGRLAPLDGFVGERVS